MLWISILVHKWPLFQTTVTCTYSVRAIMILTVLLCSELNLSVIPRYVDHLLATGVHHVFGEWLP